MSDERISGSLGERLSKIIIEAEKKTENAAPIVEQATNNPGPIRESWRFKTKALMVALFIVLVGGAVAWTVHFKLQAAQKIEADRNQVVAIQDAAKKLQSQVDQETSGEKLAPQQAARLAGQLEVDVRRLEGELKRFDDGRPTDQEHEDEIQAARLMIQKLDADRRRLAAMRRADEEHEEALKEARQISQQLEADRKRLEAPEPKKKDVAVLDVKPAGVLPVTIEGCIIIAEDKQYLGMITKNEFDSDSILNEFGMYGGKFSRTSIFNEFGQYGGEFAQRSPFNQFTANPPKIFTKGGVFVAYLSANIAKSPRIDPYVVIAVLKAR